MVCIGVNCIFIGNFFLVVIEVFYLGIFFFDYKFGVFRIFYFIVFVLGVGVWFVFVDVDCMIWWVVEIFVIEVVVIILGIFFDVLEFCVSLVRIVFENIVGVVFIFGINIFGVFCWIVIGFVVMIMIFVF